MTNTLSRHKWIILAFTVLGILCAIVVRSIKPPLYVSEAKLMLHYLGESTGVDPKEKEILTSRDIAIRVVAMLGAEKVLAKNGGGSNSMVAAGIICSGVEVVSTPSAIITVSFENGDKNIVQRVLDAVIHAYIHKHLEFHSRAGVLDEYWVKVKDLGENLTQTEEALRKAKTDTKVPFLDDSKFWYQTRIANAQVELDVAERELAERHGVLLTDMEKLEKEERTLLRQGYREVHPLVQTVRSQLRNLSVEKAQLEKDFPTLAQLSLAGTGSSTNSVGRDVASRLTEIKTLSGRVEYLGNSLSNIQAQAARVRDLEPKIAELEHQRSQLQGSYDEMVTQLTKVMEGVATKDDNVINISVVQNPSPPRLDLDKMLSLAGGVLVGCIAAGVGLAFLLDLVLDSGIKSTIDVERHLRVPVLLAIPDASWHRGRRLRWLSRRQPSAISLSTKGVGWTGEAVMAAAICEPSHPLAAYAEGLRERVCNYFEVRDMDVKKPKLVTVTGFGKGVGVSTLARGLAMGLSKMGDENVLLLDMNKKQGAAHSFFMGKLGRGVRDVVTSASRAAAQVKEKLDGISLDKSIDAELADALSKRFNYIVPKLKISDYDYIVFDMPPVSATSSTARLASHMDLTLLILESERTGQKAAALARELLQTSHTNVAAVLNKCRRHVHGSLPLDL